MDKAVSTLRSFQFKWQQRGKQNFIKDSGIKHCGFPEESKREEFLGRGCRDWKGELEHNRKEKEGKDRAETRASFAREAATPAYQWLFPVIWATEEGRQAVVLSFPLHNSPNPKNYLAGISLYPSQYSHWSTKGIVVPSPVLSTAGILYTENSSYHLFRRNWDIENLRNMPKVTKLLSDRDSLLDFKARTLYNLFPLPKVEGRIRVERAVKYKLKTWVWVMALPLKSWMTSKNSPHLSEHHFLLRNYLQRRKGPLNEWCPARVNISAGLQLDTALGLCFSEHT